MIARHLLKGCVV